MPTFHFYAQRKGYKNGTAQTPSNYFYATRLEAEKQYYLLNAAACTNNDSYDFCSIEMGTVEQGVVPGWFKFYDYRVEAEQTEEA